MRARSSSVAPSGKIEEKVRNMSACGESSPRSRTSANSAERADTWLTITSAMTVRSAASAADVVPGAEAGVDRGVVARGRSPASTPSNGVKNGRTCTPSNAPANGPSSRRAQALQVAPETVGVGDQLGAVASCLSHGVSSDARGVATMRRSHRDRADRASRERIAPGTMKSNPWLPPGQTCSSACPPLAPECSGVADDFVAERLGRPDVDERGWQTCEVRFASGRSERGHVGTTGAPRQIGRPGRRVGGPVPAPTPAICCAE